MGSTTCRESFETEVIEPFDTAKDLKQKLSQLGGKLGYYRKLVRVRFGRTHSRISIRSALRSSRRNHNIDHRFNEKKIQKPLKQPSSWSPVDELKSRVKRLSLRVSSNSGLETSTIELKENSGHALPIYQCDNGEEEQESKGTLFTYATNEAGATTGEDTSNSQQSDDQDGDIVRRPTAPYDYVDYDEEIEEFGGSPYDLRHRTFCGLPVVFETDHEACTDSKQFETLCDEVAGLAISCGNNSKTPPTSAYLTK